MKKLSFPDPFSPSTAMAITRSCAALVVACFISLGLFAQTNDPRISVQGTLKNASGATVADGNYDVTFLLYNVKTGGTALWSENATVEVVGGIYSHYLGSSTPLKPADFANTLYLGVKVGNYELVPRTELSYAPYAFSVAAAQTVLCSGAVGDIKYSILNPTEFAKVNGSCWVPMDGRSISGSVLATHGVTSIPNAGGFFLRAQEFGSHGTSPSSDKDPERTTTSNIAEIQNDEFKAHIHPFDLETSESGLHAHWYHDRRIDESSNSGVYADGDGTGERDDLRATDQGGNHSHTITGNILSSGGSETRPKNLNFWIYIRIN